jgi:CheY-like chemotaxis protein
MIFTYPCVQQHEVGRNSRPATLAIDANFALSCKECTAFEGEHVREILLAEDNPADVYLIREALREHGVDCPIRIASDGREVLRLICPADTEAPAPQFDLIVLDLNLPRHDGLEILERMRGSAQLSAIPVVILTSSDSPRDQRIANQLGAACYLRKPSSLDQFMALGAVLRSLMDGSYTQSAST